MKNAETPEGAGADRLKSRTIVNEAMDALPEDPAHAIVLGSLRV